MTSPIHPELPVASFFLRHIDGWQGRVISAAQGFVRGGSFWTHAGLILDNDEYIQGQPHGAAIYPVSSLFDGQPLLVSDAPLQAWAAGTLQSPTGGIARVKRGAVAYEARKLKGADYSYLDYPALGLAEWLRRHPREGALEALLLGTRHYINSSGHLICSALVDRGYVNGGLHLFTDGRMPGDVTPEDLAEYAYRDGRKPLIDTRENPA